MVLWKKQFNRVRHLIQFRKASYYRNLKDWWPAVNQARGKTKNNEVTLAPNLLSKEFHSVWGGGEQPDLKEFKEPLTTNDIGLNITSQITIDTLETLDATKAAGPDELNNRVLCLILIFHLSLLIILKWVNCLVYIDDIIIFSNTFEDHMKDLNAVFERLGKYNLRLKASKCNPRVFGTWDFGGWHFTLSSQSCCNHQPLEKRNEYIVLNFNFNFKYFNWYIKF